MSVLNSIELEGVSTQGWDQAAHEVLREAAKTIRHIQRMDVLGASAKVENGNVVEYRTRIRLFFRVER